MGQGNLCGDGTVFRGKCPLRCMTGAGGLLRGCEGEGAAWGSLPNPDGPHIGRHKTGAETQPLIRWSRSSHQKPLLLVPGIASPFLLSLKGIQDSHLGIDHPVLNLSPSSFIRVRNSSMLGAAIVSDTAPSFMELTFWGCVCVWE